MLSARLDVARRASRHLIGSQTIGMSDAASYVEAVLAELAARAPRQAAARAATLAPELARTVAALPDVTVTPARFAAHLAARLNDSDDQAPLQLGDLYLACACLDGDGAALLRMQREHLAAVPQMLASYPQLVIDEVVERLPERLFVSAGERLPKLAQYSGRARLRTWLKTVALNCAHDVQRRRRVVVPLADNAELIAAIGIDIEQQQGRHALAVDFRRAVTHAVAALLPEQRLLLHGMYIEGLTLKELGAPEHADPSTVFYRLKKIYATLRQDIEAFMRAELKLSPSECESLVRSMLSHLDLRITNLFPDPTR
jgi:RNA polymerase sigma-70 factor (ECF subfamily)